MKKTLVLIYFEDYRISKNILLNQGEHKHFSKIKVLLIGTEEIQVLFRNGGKTNSPRLKYDIIKGIKPDDEVLKDNGWNVEKKDGIHWVIQ